MIRILFFFSVYLSIGFFYARYILLQTIQLKHSEKITENDGVFILKIMIFWPVAIIMEIIDKLPNFVANLMNKTISVKNDKDAK